MNFKRLLIIPLVMFILPAFSQNRVITGTITDSASNRPLSGVTVMVPGTNMATATSANGTFSLNVPEGTSALSISSVGYGSKDVTIGSTPLNIALAGTAGTLNEVVVIGYGTARKKDLTGSVATVTSKDFVKGQVTTPEQLIAGKVAGVQITSNSGAPGSGSRIRIRGGTSLGASNDPLIVIDGIPLANEGIAGAANPLSLINPNDIESFSILKDASAAAIYGARAANGVILITTKKGSAGGRVIVNFNTLNSIAVKTGEVDVLTADQFRTYVNDHGSANEIALLGTANTNWQDLIYQSAFSTDNNISLSGGIKKFPYRLSLGYLNQDGILKTSNLERYSTSLNLSPKLLDDHISINTNLKYSHSNNNFANEGAIGSAVYFDPTKPVYSGL